MTREETIERIRDHRIIHKTDEPRAIKLREACEINMTVEELEALAKSMGYYIQKMPEKKDEREQLLDELSKMSPMLIATAYLYAINYVRYGEDVTERWVTATQNSRILEKAYREGYYDALQKLAESEEV